MFYYLRNGVELMLNYKLFRIYHNLKESLI